MPSALVTSAVSSTEDGTRTSPATVEVGDGLDGVLDELEGVDGVAETDAVGALDALEPVHGSAPLQAPRPPDRPATTMARTAADVLAPARDRNAVVIAASSGRPASGPRDRR
ncbi:hypothetical protein GCM10009826_10610 [Humibacillus xanthopallidus]